MDVSATITGKVVELQLPPVRRMAKSSPLLRFVAVDSGQGGGASGLGCRQLLVLTIALVLIPVWTRAKATFLR